MNRSEPLPCGCQPGFVLCPTAEDLWAETNQAWRAYANAHLRGSRPGPSNVPSYRAYRKALRAYDAHFTQKGQKGMKR